MCKWNNVQTKTELEFILNAIKEKIKKAKIVKVFSNDNNVPSKINGNIIYKDLEEPLYIFLDNGYSIIINFLFYSVISIEYKKTQIDEINKSTDYFNNHYEVYGWSFDANGKRKEESFQVKQIISINSKYDEILDIEVIGFNHEYQKWVNDGNCSTLITIPAGGDYFNSINMKLKNGIEIGICPQSAEADGYYDLIIKDNNNCINFKEI